MRSQNGRPMHDQSALHEEVEGPLQRPSPSPSGSAGAARTAARPGRARTRPCWTSSSVVLGASRTLTPARWARSTTSSTARSSKSASERISSSGGTASRIAGARRPTSRAAADRSTSGGDGAEKLVAEPAAGCRELALERREALALADEDDAPADARRPSSARARTTRRPRAAAPIASEHVTTAVGIRPSS